MESKRALYIGTPIFNYHQKIIKEFQNQGYLVDFFNDRPSESSIIKGLIKIKKNLVNKIIEKYFYKLINETREKKYDLVFIVNCKVFSSWMIELLRKEHKYARFILYMWDSFALYPNSESIVPLFDKVYSFDLEDCNRNKQLTFLPLFYSKEYEKVGQEYSCVYKYDLISVCTAHINRYVKMKKLFPKLEDNGVRIFSYMFINKLQYIYNKLFINDFKNAKKSEFEYKPLLEQEYLSYLSKSNTVFDMQHNMQSGLTMRTIETLGAKRKLITTNKSIKNYDFYNQKNILILEDDDLKTIIDFLNNEYEEINEIIYKKYSIENWLKTILNEVNTCYLYNQKKVLKIKG